MNRETQSLLVTLVGGALVRISVGDTFLRYVRDWMRPALLVAGAALILLGLVSLWRERPPRNPDAAGPAPSGHDDHGPWVAWLLVLPVLAIFLVAPPALGSYTVNRSTAAVPEPADSGFEPLPAGNPVTVSLTDYTTRAIWDRGRSLAGRQVRLIGFVSPRPGGGVHVARLTMSCCAADARPVRIMVRQAPAGLVADAWVAVTGTYGGLDPDAGVNQQVAVVVAERVEPVPAPADPYEP